MAFNKRRLIYLIRTLHGDIPAVNPPNSYHVNYSQSLQNCLRILTAYSCLVGKFVQRCFNVTKYGVPYRACSLA